MARKKKTAVKTAKSTTVRNLKELKNHPIQTVEPPTSSEMKSKKPSTPPKKVTATQVKEQIAALESSTETASGDSQILQEMGRTPLPTGEVEGVVTRLSRNKDGSIKSLLIATSKPGENPMLVGASTLPLSFEKNAEVNEFTPVAFEFAKGNNGKPKAVNVRITNSELGKAVKNAVVDSENEAADSYRSLTYEKLCAALAFAYLEAENLPEESLSSFLIEEVGKNMGGYLYAGIGIHFPKGSSEPKMVWHFAKL